jgi:hypothetical protein
VIAIGSNAKITRYAYDAAHSRLPPVLHGEEQIIGESMQLWSFSGGVAERLKELLLAYGNSARRSKTAFTHSGVYSINQLRTEIEPIVSDRPNDWLNLNTRQDLTEGEKIKWLIK